MKKIELDRLELIEGGKFIQGFCRGLNATSAIYTAGVYANLWNPVGQTAAVALAAANIACLAV